MALNPSGRPSALAEPAPVLTNAPATRKTAGGVEVPENTIVTTIDSVVSWCRKYSLWPMPFATACCGIGAEYSSGFAVGVIGTSVTEPPFTR